MQGDQQTVLYCAAAGRQRPPSFCGTKEDLDRAGGMGFAANPWRQHDHRRGHQRGEPLPEHATSCDAHRRPGQHPEGNIRHSRVWRRQGVDAIVAAPRRRPGHAAHDPRRLTSRAAHCRSLSRQSRAARRVTDYTASSSARTSTSTVVQRSTWMAAALGGKGSVAYLGGPPGSEPEPRASRQASKKALEGLSRHQVDRSGSL